MTTPYVTPQELIAAPTGISWSTIPAKGASAQEQLAEQTNIAWRASDAVDTWCNQPLRATVDVEQASGPDYRLTIRPDGTARMLVSRWPIITVLSSRVSPASAFPPAWQAVDVSKLRPEETLIGLQGSSVGGASAVGPVAILFAPGVISRSSGRNGYLLEATYVNGWPHAGLTADATGGATALAVDDVTGFTGANARIYDGANTEVVTVASIISVSGNSGPGTLTLTTPTLHAHPTGVMISSLPGTVIEAAILFAIAEATQRGSTSITVQSMPGSMQSAGGPSIKETVDQAHKLLIPYRRVI